MESIFGYLFLAMLLEAVVEGVSKLYDRALNWKMIVAAVLGGAASYAYGFSVAGMAGLTLAGPEWLGIILDVIFAGVILMRGSGFVNDFFSRVTALRG